MRERREVAVTGIGLVSPIGQDEETFMASLLEGRDGMGPVEFMDIATYRTRNGAEIANDILKDALAAHDWKSTDRVIDMGLLATSQALDAAGLDQEARSQTGALIGCSHGPTEIVGELYHRFVTRGHRGTRPTSIPRGMVNVVSSQISMRFGLQGPNYVVASACSSSTSAIGLAFRMIRDGYADFVLCGGTDSFFTPALYAAWDRLGVMSKTEDPHAACRPFAADRDGFLLGEGAGMLILEALETAQARGARIRGRICGFGETSDAGHLTRPSEEGQSRAIRHAMDDAGIEPADLAFVNAHGTATRWNDDCESKAIRMVLGDETDRVPVVSNKSFFGHTLGAAGALETIAAVLALEARTLPANLNLDNPDPECKVCLPREGPVIITSDYAIKNSFGFGGGNVSLALGRHSDPGDN